MKILQIFNRYLERGGEEIFVEQATRDLAEQHEVRNLVFSSASWKDDGLLSRLTQPFRMFRNPESLRALRKEVEDFRPDVALVHNVFPVGSLAIYRQLHKAGIPVVQYAHNYRPFSVNGYCWANSRIETAGLKRNFLPEIIAGSWQGSRLKTACYAAVLYTGHLTGIWRNVTHWIAISEFVKKVLIRGGISAERISVVPNQIGSESPAHPSRPREKFLLYIGRLSEEKGVRVLGEAWKTVESRGADGKLVIAGDGPLKNELAESLKDCDRVEFTGFASGERKDALLSGCRAMVIPSVWWEAFGLVACEAYKWSKPVLAAASGGLREIVVDGKTGWLHPPGDAAVLADQIQEAFSDETACLSRGASGNEWLRNQSTTAGWLDQIDDVLRTSIAENSVSH